MSIYVNENALAYAMLTFGANLIHSIFIFYYVQLFLDHYKISQAWFDFAQIFYLFWNAINDPLFAYCQDNSKIKWFRSRRLNVLYAAPFFALSFLIPWFPWGDYEDQPWLGGVHLLVSLSLYDTMYTFSGLANCALYSEISQTQEDRLQLTRYNQVAVILGSSSVFFSQIICDGLNNMRAFRIYVVIVAFISWCAMNYSGKNVRTRFDDNLIVEDLAEPPLKSPYRDHHNQTSSSSVAFTQFKQICKDKNFLLFVTINFMQTFQSTYVLNFLPIFGDELLPDEVVSPFFRKCLYGCAFIVPQLLVLCLSTVVGRKGYYRVMQWSYYFKMFYAALMFLIGRQHLMILAAFFLIEASVPEAIFSFQNLPLTDIIDADQQRFNRRLPLSSSVFAYNALATKPAESVAPMLIVHAILDRHNYQYKLAEDMPPEQTQELKSSMFLMMCAIPFVLGLLQIFVWRKFTIRDSHKTVAKHADT